MTRELQAPADPGIRIRTEVRPAEPAAAAAAAPVAA